MLHTSDLEKIFSANKQSAVFPILANIYYKKKLYQYAARICKIGLAGDPDNLEGLYVLAKTLLIQGKIESAEKTLKNISRISPYHLRSSLLLICVLKNLNRNKKTLESYIKKTQLFYPHHPKLQEYCRQYCADIKKSNGRKKNKKRTIPRSKIFDHNPKLATLTMYKLLHSQKKYSDAFALLKILGKNPKYKKFVNEEFKKIKIKLNRG